MSYMSQHRMTAYGNASPSTSPMYVECDKQCVTPSYDHPQQCVTLNKSPAYVTRVAVWYNDP